MPELPEVETTRRGIEPHLVNHRVVEVLVRQPKLRQRVSPQLVRQLPGLTIESVERRAKYLLLGTAEGTVILHLGMSGSLRVVPRNLPPKTHDHLDIVLDNGMALRFHDPRRFGTVVWTQRPPLRHKLLRDLGPEPFGTTFTGNYLYTTSRNRRVAVKQYIMDSHVVVGVGNIYASEALFRAGIDPRRGAGRIARARYQRLADAIKTTLGDAIAQGGTTLRDYLNENGRPGYFSLHLNVYERDGKPCHTCGTAIRRLRQGQRSSYYCPRCQR